MMKFEDVVEYINDGTLEEHINNSKQYDAIMNKARRIYNNLPEIFSEAPIVGNDELNCAWYRVKDKEELSALKLALFDHDCVALETDTDEFPTWVFTYCDREGYGGLIPSVKMCRGIAECYFIDIEKKIENEERRLKHYEDQN